MRLLEHTAKAIFRNQGFCVPKSLLILDEKDFAAAAEEIGFPMVLKIQTLTGGRGKRGGILVASNEQEAINWLTNQLGREFNGQQIESVLCEEWIPFTDEYYVSFALDTIQREVTLIFSTAGGVDIEENADEQNLFKTIVRKDRGLEAEALTYIFSEAKLQEERWPKMMAVLNQLYDVFLSYDCMLLEINPLVWTETNEPSILDIHFYMDDNAILYHDVAKETVLAMKDLYKQSWLKINYGFDLVELNPQGTVALLSTGAGLSMAIVDELKSRNIEPINFADVRSGQLKGDPTRLIVMLKQFSQYENLDYIFVSIFAGITDLAEFAELLLIAKDQVKFDKEVKWIIRLEGNNFDKAKQLIQQKGLFITNSLEESLTLFDRR